jgi:hypothetical protein
MLKTLNPFTIVYMFDNAMPPAVYEPLAKIFNRRFDECYYFLSKIVDTNTTYRSLFTCIYTTSSTVQFLVSFKKKYIQKYKFDVIEIFKVHVQMTGNK